MAEPSKLETLFAEYGYVPSDDGHDVCTVINGLLIVQHPNRLPRTYDKGCQGRFAEMDNGWPW